jgi:hypothetical protein
MVLQNSKQFKKIVFKLEWGKKGKFFKKDAGWV